MDLRFLVPLATRPGPYASVYLDLSHATEDADHQIALRWRALAEALAEQGCDDKTIAALGDAVTGGPPVVGTAGRVLVASEGTVVLDRMLPAPPRREIARLAPLPHLAPLLAQAPATVPHLTVVADRLGADVTAYGESATPVAEDEITGTDHHVHKVPGGGWAHRRYQQRVEETWERNARQVVDRIDELVREIGAELVVLGGEVRARAALTDALPERLRAITVQTDTGGRADGAAVEPFTAEVHRLVRQRTLERHADVIADYATELAHGGRAAEGLAAVLRALRQAAVDTLLLVDDPSSDATLWIGPDPIQLATDPAELRALGVDEPEQDRVDAAVVRALVATGASLVVLDDEAFASEVLGGAQVTPPRDGVGALLRHTSGV